MSDPLPRSLKWTLQTWHGLILFAVLVVLGTGFFYYEKAHRLAKIDQALDDRLPPIIGVMMMDDSSGPRGDRMGLRRDPPPSQALDRAPVARSRTLDGWTLRFEGKSNQQSPRSFGPPGPDRLEKFLLAHGYYAKVVSLDTLTDLFVTENFPDIEMPVGATDGYYLRTREGRYRELLHTNPRVRVLVGIDLTAFHAGLRILLVQILGGTLLIFALGMGIGSVLVSRSLAPLQTIQTSAAQIAAGKLQERIPTNTKGQSKELVLLTRDLNETFDRLEQLFTRQIQFTADASHELRTPLTALTAQLQLGRKRRRTPEEYEQILAVCSRSSERIQRITEQLIDLSRYDAGRVELDYETLPLATVLQDVADDLQAYVAENAGTLRTELGPGSLCCDAFRLEQVIINLINNALQHNTGPVDIRLTARCENDHALIEVIDNGRGIQPENLDRLFDRFFQEDTARSKRKHTQNSGLGLAICRAIIEAHGGTLTARSEPQRETVFTIRLPVAPP